MSLVCLKTKEFHLNKYRRFLMSQLIEQHFPLEEIVHKYQEQGFHVTSVKNLLRLEEEGEVALFQNQQDCFWWMHDSDDTRYSTLNELLTLTSEQLQPYENILSYQMAQENIVTLTDGRVVFIYA